MSFLLALLIGGAGLAWVWGSLTGRLGSMLAALVNPAWLVASTVTTGNSGAGAIGPQGQIIGTPGQTISLAPGEPYTPGMPSYPNYKTYGKGGGSTVIAPSSLPGAGTTGGEGL